MEYPYLRDKLNVTGEYYFDLGQMALYNKEEHEYKISNIDFVIQPIF